MIQYFNREIFDSLRKQFKYFKFSDFEYSAEDGKLSVTYCFSIEDKIFFHPSFEIPARDFYHWNEIPENQLKTLIFNVGMVELISYWKLACPQKVIVKPFHLDENQTKWWKKLYYNGLGEFFYLNGINVGFDEFMTIECETDLAFEKVSYSLEEQVVVPVGGGKDSVVTVETLKNRLKMFPFIVNPRGATKGCVKTAGFDENQTIVINRTLDPTMLKMNGEGYLNGHTPFSALLAFLSILVGFGTRSKYIALSNESSASEPTVPETEINHQYSKSIAFERDFRDYIKDYVNDEIQYFSFLRPLNEIQIAQLFSKSTEYHKVFKSCNAGSKTDSWCGKCPKCLFTWIALSPFLSHEKLVEIFGKDLMADASLTPILQQLNGTLPVKPFECVGTVGEVNACLNNDVSMFLNRFDENNFLPEKFKSILKDRIL